MTTTTTGGSPLGSLARLLAWMRSGATAAMRGMLACAALAVSLAALGGFALLQEREIAAGRTVLLPLDEYAVGSDAIDLRYPLLSGIGKRENVLDWILTGFDNRVYNLPLRGQLVLKLDERGVLLYGRPYERGNTLREQEILVNFHRTRYEIFITPGRLRLPEGQRDSYARARYAEVSVGADGQAVLTGFRDERLTPVGAPLFP